MKAGKLFITEERIKRLETAKESLLYKIVKFYPRENTCVSCRSNYLVTKCHREEGKLDDSSNI